VDEEEMVEEETSRLERKREQKRPIREKERARETY
jgi:hypothetical protein